jgi:hypothetical protein
MSETRRNRCLLKLRPTGLGSGIDKDRPDYSVFTGEWNIGRIYQTRRPRQSALVLVHERQWSNDALGSGGDSGGSQGAVSKERGPVVNGPPARNPYGGVMR